VVRLSLAVGFGTSSFILLVRKLIGDQIMEENVLKAMLSCPECKDTWEFDDTRRII